MDMVAAVRRSMPDPEVVEALAEGVFGLLADPTRLRLLMSLREAGELCVNDLAAAPRTGNDDRRGAPHDC